MSIDDIDIQAVYLNFLSYLDTQCLTIWNGLHVVIYPQLFPCIWCEGHSLASWVDGRKLTRENLLALCLCIFSEACS